jgi:hypothetical protein
MLQESVFSLKLNNNLKKRLTDLSSILTAINLQNIH